jgi:hypothetical protein
MSDGDPQQAAEAELAIRSDRQRTMNPDLLAVTHAGDIADELTRIRFEMTAIRQLLESLTGPLKA